MRLGLAIVSIFIALCNSQADDLTKYVDPLIGTEGAIPGVSKPRYGELSFVEPRNQSSLGGGNMFPGVAIPFGQVKLGIDTSVLNLDQGGISSANSGYTPRGNATGFSLLHTSGTGGQPKYGVVSQMPLLGSLEEQKINVADNRTYLTNRTNEVARVGYFRTTFETSKITTELTASHHAAHVLPSGGGGYISQRYVKGELTVDPQGGGYSGSAWYNLGWNQGEAWQIFFCGNFSKPPSRIRSFWTPYNHLVPPVTTPTLSAYYDIYASDNLAIGALFSWEFESSQGLEIESRIGVSFINAQKACQFVKDEVPWSKSFNSTVQAVKDVWNKEILSSITVPAENGHANDTARASIHHLYGTALMPTDRTNETQAGGIPKSRTMMIGIRRFDGYLPDGRSGNQNGRTQGGSNADNVLADAYVKGLNKVKSINWKDAYKAVVSPRHPQHQTVVESSHEILQQKDAEVTPRRNIDFNAFDGGTKEGRNALPDWVSLGYITQDYSRSISKGVEYAQNDFAAYLLAKTLGSKKDAEKYLQRASNWKNFWNENATVDLGDAGLGVHKGFFGSKSAQGIFDASLTYEGLIWEYSFNVPHDTAALIKLMDGPLVLKGDWTRLLLRGFPWELVQLILREPLFNPGNEPSFQTPFLYNYINGKQYKTVEKTRYIVNKYAGAMATWLLWNLLGYANRYWGSYLSITSKQNIFTDTSAGLRRKPSVCNVYWVITICLSIGITDVQGVKINGKPINRSFIWHDEIINGGVLEFTMGPEAVGWDSGELPPSLSTGWK
ncbi:Glycosyl hydrolase family 92 [Rhizoctonia solani]|uniref:Glycosyl hydrolase family 92 n=1 Tax=Rhizoctonia solani TaxID=456999 RepID=A0A8H7IJ23_9AGAM|nr:Glycosyl hydrolase family 92 [Rhizoctonia solani]